MILIPFQPEHMLAIALQSKQAGGNVLISPSYAQSLKEGGEAFTAVDGELVYGCLGTFTVWDGRAIGWAALSGHSGRILHALSFRARAFFKACPYHRIEAYVDPGFPEAIRWVELLGFVREGLMRAFLPDKSDQLLYARVR